MEVAAEGAQSRTWANGEVGFNAALRCVSMLSVAGSLADVAIQVMGGQGRAGLSGKPPPTCNRPRLWFAFQSCGDLLAAFMPLPRRQGQSISRGDKAFRSHPTGRTR